jgi:hypothetical protein
MHACIGGGSSSAATRPRACGCRWGGRSWVGYLGSPYGGGLGLLGAGRVWVAVSGGHDGRQAPACLSACPEPARSIACWRRRSWVGYLGSPYGGGLGLLGAGRVWVAVSGDSGRQTLLGVSVGLGEPARSIACFITSSLCHTHFRCVWQRANRIMGEGGHGTMHTFRTDERGSEVFRQAPKDTLST